MAKCVFQLARIGIHPSRYTWYLARYIHHNFELATSRKAFHGRLCASFHMQARVMHN